MSAYYYNQEFIDAIAGGGLSTTDTFINDSTHALSGQYKIQDSIYNILSTRIGERILMPEFGSQLYKCIFEPNDYIFQDMADFYIREALNKWEKRITVESTEVGLFTEGNTVPIKIFYRIKNSNIQSSYVYPFKINDYGNPDMYNQGDITPEEYI